METLQTTVRHLIKENQRLRSLVTELGGNPNVVSRNPLERKKYSQLFVEIKPGVFSLGAFDGDHDADAEEYPKHQVTLSRTFAMSRYQVTQNFWEKVMDMNPSFFIGTNRPVENVNWLDCILFCNKYSEIKGLE